MAAPKKSENWPTIKKPFKPPNKTDVYWDHHIQEWVPTLKKAQKKSSSSKKA